MFIDSHAHIEMPQFEEDLPDVLQRAQQYGVEAIITVGTNPDLSRRTVALAHQHPEIYATVGIHPHYSGCFGTDVLELLKGLAEKPKVVAVGEIGLDYCRNLSPADAQVRAFREQIRLARETGKPIVIHDRDAHPQMLKILREEHAEEVGGVIHCFSGDLSMAEECLEMGFYISVPGSITFKNAARLRHVVCHLPADRLLLETDCPFLAPIPYRGKRNEPALIRYTADRVAKIRKVPLEALAEQTCANARALFHLDSVL